MPVNLNYGPTSQYTVSGCPPTGPTCWATPWRPRRSVISTTTSTRINIAIPADPLHPYPFGSAGRNIVRSLRPLSGRPGRAQGIPAVEGGQKRIEFRPSSSICFNKTNFQAPNSTVSSSGFRDDPQRVSGAGDSVRAEIYVLAVMVRPEGSSSPKTRERDSRSSPGASRSPIDLRTRSSVAGGRSRVASPVWWARRRGRPRPRRS